MEFSIESIFVGIVVAFSVWAIFQCIWTEDLTYLRMKQEADYIKSLGPVDEWKSLNERGDHDPYREI